MADRSLREKRLQTEPMAERDIDHICTYVVDEEDRNFKVCIYCEHTVYRTDEELSGDYNTLLKRGKGGD